MFSIGSFIVTWPLTSIGVFSDNQFSLYWEQAYCLSRQTLPILFQLRCDIGVVTLHICSDNRAMYSYWMMILLVSEPEVYKLHMGKVYK